MKFHLSTLLLAMVIVALGIGWYLITTIRDGWRSQRGGVRMRHAEALRPQGKNTILLHSCSNARINLID